MIAARDRRTPRKSLMRTSAVALECDVTPETVIEWMKAGRLTLRRTPGGHYRFDPAEVDALMEEIDNEARACGRAGDQESGENIPADMACERAV